MKVLIGLRRTRLDFAPRRGGIDTGRLEAFSTFLRHLARVVPSGSFMRPIICNREDRRGQ